MSTTIYMINDEPMDLAQIDLPPYISASTGDFGYGARTLTLRCGGSQIEDGAAAVTAAYPAARATALRSQAHAWLGEPRQITPHKGGRTIKRSTDVSPEVDAMLKALHANGISLGDLVEEAARTKHAALQHE